MTEAAEPAHVREVVDRLEDEILDLDRAAGDDDERSTEDTTGSVPGAPEPPD